MTGTLGPLELNSLEGRVLLGGLDVFLYRGHIATHGSVDTVARNKNAALQFQGFAQGQLPESNGLRISERREAVIENDLGFHRTIVILSPRGLT